MDIFPSLLATLGLGLLGYLSGSLPFAMDHAPLQRRGRARRRLHPCDRDAPCQKRAIIEKVSRPYHRLSLAVRRFTCGTLGDLLYNENYEQPIQKS